jgi:hypothetical protein
MPDIQWDSEASLMRVTPIETSGDQLEELVARGSVHELVGRVLELPPGQNRHLLLRAAGPDWTQEFDGDALRELAARPEYTSAHGAFDTADLADDPDVREVED